MTNVPLSQIEIDVDLPLGGTKKIVDARQIGLREDATVGAKKAIIEINSAGQVVIGDGSNPVVPFYSVVTGKVIGGALPTGNEVLSTVVAPTVTNTFLKAVVAGPNISFVWEAVSGGSFALSGDPNPTLAADMVTGSNKVKKGTAGTDAYMKMGTSLIEVGTGAGVSYTIPTTAVAHKPVKMNSAGNALEFANIRAVDVGLSTTYSGNLAASAPTTVEALGTAVDGLVLPTYPSLIIKEEFIGDFSYTTSSHTGIESAVAPGGWTFAHVANTSLFGTAEYIKGPSPQFGVLHLTSSAGSNTSIFYKDAIFFTGQNFTLKIKARVQGGGLRMGLITASTVAWSGELVPNYDNNALAEISLSGGNSGGNSTWSWYRADGTTATSTTTESVAQATYVNVQIRMLNGVLKASVIGGSGDYPDITTVIPDDVWLIPSILALGGSDVFVDTFDLVVE